MYTRVYTGSTHPVLFVRKTPLGAFIISHWLNISKTEQPEGQKSLETVLLTNLEKIVGTVQVFECSLEFSRL